MKISDIKAQNGSEKFDDGPEADKSSDNSEAQSASSRDEQKQRLQAVIDKKVAAERQRMKPIKIASIVVAGLAMVGIVVGIALYNQAQYLASPEGIAAEQQAQVDKLVKKVSKLTDLPDERPLATTITKIDKLKSQTFFAEAADGDEVLVFEVTGRAIIYRESENIIVNDGPLVDTNIE